MKRTLPAVWISLMIACSAFATPAAAPTSRSSPVFKAERIVQISGDPESVQSALEAVESIVAARTNGGSFAPQEPLRGLLFELGVDDNDVQINVDFNHREIDLSVTRLPEKAASLDAAKVADLVLDSLKDRFANQSARFLAEAKDDEQKIDHVNDLEHQRDTRQAHVREITGVVDTSPPVIRQRVDAMQAERETDAIDLAAKQARSDALAGQISKFSSQIQDKIKTDPIAAELSKVVDARQREYGEARGTKTEDEAMASLSEAKAKLLERQETAANAAGGDMITTWNRELMTLSIDIAELGARVKALDGRLAAYDQVHDYLDHAEQWDSQIAELKKQLPGLQSDEQNALEQAKANTINWQVVSSKDSTDASTEPSK